jgi:RNA polymerase sigma-70 factor (ECF subfamily)
VRSAHARVQTLAVDLAPDLLAYFVRRVDTREDAADLLSETLTVLVRRARDIPADDVEARLWTYGVARKVLGTHRRTLRRRGALLERLRGELHVASTSAPPSEAADLINAALQDLDPIDQEIIRLVHWDGFTQAEVARVLERPEGTVRSRYARARARLKDAIAEMAET